MLSRADDARGWAWELVLLVELDHMLVVVVPDPCYLEAVAESGEGGAVVVVIRCYLGGPVVVLGS